MRERPSIFQNIMQAVEIIVNPSKTPQEHQKRQDFLRHTLPIYTHVPCRHGVGRERPETPPNNAEHECPSRPQSPETTRWPCRQKKSPWIVKSSIKIGAEAPTKYRRPRPWSICPRRSHMPPRDPSPISWYRTMRWSNDSCTASLLTRQACPSAGGFCS